MKQQAQTPRMLRRPALARYLGLSRHKLLKLEALGLPKIPQFPEEQPLFDRLAVEEWLKARGLIHAANVTPIRRRA